MSGANSFRKLSVYQAAREAARIMRPDTDYRSREDFPFTESLITDHVPTDAPRN